MLYQYVSISVIKAEVKVADEWESESSARHYHKNQSSVGGVGGSVNYYLY